jgi:hypothetical protein
LVIYGNPSKHSRRITTIFSFDSSSSCLHLGMNHSVSHHNL